MTERKVFHVAKCHCKLNPLFRNNSLIYGSISLETVLVLTAIKILFQSSEVEYRLQYIMTHSILQSDNVGKWRKLRPLKVAIAWQLIVFVARSGLLTMFGEVLLIGNIGWIPWYNLGGDIIVLEERPVESGYTLTSSEYILLVVEDSEVVVIIEVGCQEWIWRTATYAYWSSVVGGGLLSSSAYWGGRCQEWSWIIVD